MERVRGTAVVTVVIVLLAGCSALGWWYVSGDTARTDPTTSVELPGGELAEVRLADDLVLRVPAGGVPPGGARLDVTPVKVDPLGALVAPALDLRLSSGQPNAPWTLLWRPAAPRPADAVAVLVSQRAAAPGEIAAEDVSPARWNTDRTAAEFTVEHLSWKWIEEFSGATTAAVGKYFDQRTDPPVCAGARPSWLDDAVYLDGDPNAPLLTCIGADPADAGTAVVKIANNRGATLVLRSPVAPTWVYADSRLGSLQDYPPRLIGGMLDRVAETTVAADRTWLVQPGDELHLGLDESAVRGGDIPFTLSGTYTTTGVAFGVITNLAIDLLDTLPIDRRVADGLAYAVAAVCLPTSVDDLPVALAAAARCVLESPETVIAPWRAVAGGLPDGVGRGVTELKRAMRLLVAVEYAGFVLPDLTTTLLLDRGAREITLFTTTVTPPPGPGGDLAALWRARNDANDLCRGTPGDDGGTCARRDALQEQHFRESAAAFLAAWRAHDAASMRALSAPDATDTFGRPLVENLLESSPAEDAFDLRYDVRWSGETAGYITTVEGPDLYVSWDIDLDRGWLVQSFAPDVG